MPPERGAVAHNAPLPQRITGAGRFDFDDFRAEVAKYAAGERPGNQLAEFEYTNAA